MVDIPCHMRADAPNSEMSIDGVKYPRLSIDEQQEIARKANEKMAESDEEVSGNICRPTKECK